MTDFRTHRIPRIWSNSELKKFAHHFTGDIVNVSGWKDIDKEGDHYSNYFKNKESYTITNFEKEKRGFQGYDNEIFLDLEKELPDNLVKKYDVVFNHTTLEHVFDFQKAFENLSKLTKDVLIIVVPFMQQMHGTYGDYWRFSPEAVDKLLVKYGFNVAYLSFNNQSKTSVYIFAIGVKDKSRWNGVLPFQVSYIDSKFEYLNEPFAGCNVITKGWYNNLFLKIIYNLKKLGFGK